MVLLLIPNGNIKNSYWFKSFLFVFPHVERKEEKGGNRERTMTHIHRTKQHRVFWVQIIWIRLSQMHKLTHLKVSVFPKYIFFSLRLLSPSSFLVCHMTTRRPIPVVLEVFFKLAFRYRSISPAGHMPLFFSGQSDRKGRFPVGEAQASKTGNMQALPIPLSWKTGSTGVIHKLV